MSLTSHQLNYLVWRYLQESGFKLTTYSLQQEAKAHTMEEQMGDKTPIGTLIRLVQKGIQLTEIEAQIRKETSGEAQNRMYELMSILERDTELEKDPAPVSNGTAVTANGEDDNNDKEEATTTNNNNNNGTSTNHSNEKNVQVDTLTDTRPKLRSLGLTYQSGSSASVSQWSPTVDNVLAFGDFESRVQVIKFNGEYTDGSITTLHHNLSAVEKEREVTAMAWNKAGTLLATATFDGQIRLWNIDGKQRHSLLLHRAPVLVIKWNPSGTLVMSVDCTNMVVVWDAMSGDIRQSFQHDMVGSAGTDAAWIDGTTYATTGDQSSIMVYKVGERVPMLRFSGHTAGLNSIQFDEETQLLASGGDDCTVRIWHGRSTSPISTLAGHEGSVLVVRWIKPPVAGLDSNHRSLLASASTDGTIRLWNAESGSLLMVLSLHVGPIFCCEVCPNGRFIATGGVDGTLILWDVKNPKEEDNPESRAIASYQLTDSEESAISSISWNKSSTKLFASFADQTVVLDVPKIGV